MTENIKDHVAKGYLSIFAIRDFFIQKIHKIYEENKTPTIFSLLCVLLCHESMAQIRILVDIFIVICIYISCYISSNRFFNNIKKLKEIINKTFDYILLFFLYVYVFVSVFGAIFLENDIIFLFSFFGKLPFLNQYSKFIYIIITVFWTIPVFIQFILILNSFLQKEINIDYIMSIKHKVYAFCFLLAYYTVWIIAFNPCITSPDSAYLFSQAHVMGEVPMPNWHPPFYAIVLHFLLKICDSVTFLIYVQCLAFAILLINIIDFLLKNGISKKIALLLYIILGFSFNNVIQMVTLWKDIPYMISLLWLTFVLIKFVLSKGCIGKILYFELYFSLLFTAFFRQNGILPAIIVVIFFMVYSIKKRIFVYIIPVFFFILSCIIIYFPTFNYYKVQPAHHLKYFAMTNDILGVYVRTGHVNTEAMELINRVRPEGIDKLNFNYYWTDYSSFEPLADYSIQNFLSIYIQTFLEHPKSLLLSIMRRNSVIWSVLKPFKEPPGCVLYLGEYHHQGNYDYPHRKSNILTKFLTYTSYITYFNTIYVFLWRIGIYLLIIMFFIFFLIKDRKLFFLVPFIPILINVLALAISSGWTDYRYYWPTSIITLILLAYMRLILGKNKHSHILTDGKDGINENH